MADRVSSLLSISWRLPLESSRRLTRLALSPLTSLAGSGGTLGSMAAAVERGVDELFRATEEAAEQLQDQMLDLLFDTAQLRPFLEPLEQDVSAPDPEPAVGPDAGRPELPVGRRLRPAVQRGVGRGSAAGGRVSQAPRKVRVENTAQAYLELLEALGVRYFFGNAGSDFPSLIDAFAKRAKERKTAPRPILIPHETCAVSMAHGYHLVTGEPPVVMVHSTVGTANALCGIINASRSGIPLIMTAGRTSVHEEGVPGSRELVIHWSQEALDQGSLTRSFTKWDYELRSFRQLETVVRRAFTLATTEPRGPVYLTLPRDLLAEPQTDFTIHPPSGVEGWSAAAIPYPDPDAVGRAARLLAGAAQPLILTRSFGRRPEAVRHLVDLAESFAIPVVEYQIPEFLNFPHSHPLHLGFGGPPSGIALLDQADVILVIDCPMPWAPDKQRPRPEARVIHLGVDPLQTRYPIWGFPATLAIPADSAATVALLAAELRERRKGREPEIEARHARIRQIHDQQRAAWAEIARQGGAGPLSNFFWVSHCLSQIKDEDMIVVQEYNLALEAIPFDQPGSYVGFAPSGGLGFGVGGALGVKLGAPEKTVVSVVGDGTYILGASSAAHMVSAQYSLPILWVVTNNRGWAAMAWQTDSVHAGGWAKRTNQYPLTRFEVDSAWEKVVEAFGGHGEVVRTPQELPSALERALRVVREEGRQALVNVYCDFYFWDPVRAARPAAS
jgi:acetolactate synthase I/II/III large subunit